MICCARSCSSCWSLLLGQLHTKTTACYLSEDALSVAWGSFFDGDHRVHEVYEAQRRGGTSIADPAENLIVPSSGELISYHNVLVFTL
jgi:hypothetical protein